MSNKKGLLIFGAVLGLVILVAGAYIGFKILPDYLDYRVAEASRLEPGSNQYKRWKDPPYKMPLKIYLFSVSNPDEVQLGLKPVLTEIGPCVYNLVISRENITHDFSTGTIKYSQKKTYKFDQEQSICNEGEEITVLNVPLNAAFEMVAKLEYLKDIVLYMLNASMAAAFNVDQNKPSMFLKVKVKDYLFGGYEFCSQHAGWHWEEYVLCMGIRILAKAGLSRFLEFQGFEKPVSFSFVKYRAQADDGIYNISSGLKFIRDLGSINTWNQLKYTDYWLGHNSECDRIYGTDSTIYSPFKDLESILTIYNTDICRTVNLKYYSDITNEGIQGLRNIVEENSYSSSGKLNCYCTLKIQTLDGNTGCQPNGFLDLTSCVGLPILASHPHMMWSSGNYNLTVDGLYADPEQHISFVDIEPYTGQLLKSSNRLQYNMIIRKIERLDVTQHLTPAAIPILWIDEVMAIPDDMIENLKKTYLNDVPIVEITKWTLMTVGGVLFIICAGILIGIKIMSYS